MNSKTPFYDFTNSNNEISEYFNALPKSVQETIMQTGTDIKSLNELKNIAEELTGKN